ncbi:MAG: hypothetical protein AB8B74_14720 [Crocinitomicaceae bacterium]
MKKSVIGKSCHLIIRLCLIFFFSISCSLQKKEDPILIEGYWKVIPIGIEGSDSDTWMLWKFGSNSKIYSLASQRLGEHIPGDTLEILNWKLKNSNHDIVISGPNAKDSKNGELIYGVTKNGDDLLLKLHEEFEENSFFHNLKLEKYKGQID